MKFFFKKIIVSILTWEAKLVLRKYNPKIVAVTGSVGKTSTKDAIFSVLSHFFHVRKSEKSFNSELGVPLTILGCPTGWSNPALWLQNIFEGFILILFPSEYPKWLILEIGADRPRDIEILTSWIKPDIAVITRLSEVPVHVEYFPSPEALMREKGFLARALKRDGVLILNSDDEYVRAFSTLTEANTIFYGMNNSDMLASDYKIEYEKKELVGVSFLVGYAKEIDKVVIHGGLGHQQVYPALAALSVGISQGLSFKKMIKTFSHYEVPKGRMKIIRGVKESTIIDDSYNSSPVAVHEALNTLQQIETLGRKIAVLGDMLELGTYSLDEHKKVGQHVAQVAAILITVGIRARAIAEGALNSGMAESCIFQFEDAREAGKHLELLLASMDVVLIKGSQGVRMERTVEEVLANPSQKEKLLVRQDKEWANR